jgi:hypothetical protein
MQSGSAKAVDESSGAVGALESGRSGRGAHLTDALKQAIACARRAADLDHISLQSWKAYYEGLIGDAEAQSVAEANVRRRAELAAAKTEMQSRAPRRPGYQPCKSPDREASRRRAGRNATTLICPAEYAEYYTIGERAVWSVIGRVIREQGACDWHIDTIAATAGVSRSTCKRAIRKAEFLGHAHSKERRVPGQKSLPNIVTIINPVWAGWLRWNPTGVQKGTTTRITRETVARSHTKPAPSVPAKGPNTGFQPLSEALGRLGERVRERSKGG